MAAPHHLPNRKPICKSPTKNVGLRPSVLPGKQVLAVPAAHRLDWGCQLHSLCQQQFCSLTCSGTRCKPQCSVAHKAPYSAEQSNRNANLSAALLCFAKPGTCFGVGVCWEETFGLIQKLKLAASWPGTIPCAPPPCAPGYFCGFGCLSNSSSTASALLCCSWGTKS